MSHLMVPMAIIFLTLTACGQGPPAPALSVADSERLAMLHEEGRSLWTQARFADALKPAREVVEIRRRAQGDGHWELVDAEWLVKTLEAAAKAPAAAQAELARFHQLKRSITTLDAQRKHAEAEAAARQMLAAFRTGLGENWPLTAYCYTELGFVLHQRGKLTEAEPLYRQSFGIYDKVFGPDHPASTMPLINLAACLQDQARYVEAEPLLHQVHASRIKVLGAEHPLTLSAANDLATLLLRQDKLADADALSRQVLRIRERVLGSDHPQTAVSQTNLGAVLESLGRPAEAEQLYRRAWPVLVQRLGEHHPHATATLNNLASVVGKQGRHAEAVELVKQTLELHRKHDGEGHASTARAWSNLGFHLDLQGKHQQGEQAARKALDLRKKLWGDDHPETALSHYNLSLNLAAQRRDPEALTACQAAAASYEMARLRLGARGLDRAFYGNERSPYRLLATLHARSGRAVEAQQAIEMDLARGLLDDARSRRGIELDDAQRTRRLQLLKQIQELRGQIAQKSGAAAAEANAEELRRLGVAMAAVEQEFSRFAAEVSQRGVAAFADVQRSLPSDGALIAWVDVQDVSQVVDEHWGCVLRAQGPPHWVRLPGSGPNGQWTAADSRLPRRIPPLLAEPSAVRQAERESLTAGLVQQRIDPLRAQLQDVRRIFAVPWGALTSVPVEVLLPDATVSYVHSGTHLRQAIQPTPPARPARLLALGDPPYADSPWKPLPGSALEVQAIAALFEQPEVLLGTAAREETLNALRAGGKLKDFRVLHFATHGQGTITRPLESALILAQDRRPDPRPEGQPPVDGRLTVREVLDTWQLDADLVVLSACESALGRAGGGDGMIGFSQAFQLAGSRSVILSLWPVSDTATSLLMVRFYENWLGRPSPPAPLPGGERGARHRAPMAKAEALQEAKQWLRTLTRKDVEARIANLPAAARGLALEPAAKPQAALEKPFAHPYYWSAFILIGDPS